MTGRLIVVVGGQFGSEAKGHLCAQLGNKLAPNSLVVRTGGPNAGHTVVDRTGRTWKLRHLPTPVVMRSDITMALAARSVVDPKVLFSEIRELTQAGIAHELVIDPAATILDQDCIDEEENTARMHDIGSTRKGIGAARKARIGRVAQTAKDVFGEGYLGNVSSLIEYTLDSGGDVLIEAAQGYGLGLHTPYYPTVTSADCTAIDALADCRISPWALGNSIYGSIPEVWMVMRPYPIRVAGTSGPLYGETTWEELGLPEERTTVTNKVRRVGRWDPELATRATIANGGRVNVALTMVDQVIPALAGIEKPRDLIALLAEDLRVSQHLQALTDRVSTDCLLSPIRAIGTGPGTMVFAEDAGRAQW